MLDRVIATGSDLVRLSLREEHPLDRQCERSPYRSTFVPIQNAHRAKRVPAARLALPFVHFEIDRTRMRILQGPASVFGSLALDKLDRLGDPLVRLDARAAQVVEPAQHVVQV